MGTYIYPIGIFFNPCTACWGIYIYPMVIYIYPMGIHIYLWEYFSTLVKLPLGYIYLPYGYTSTLWEYFPTFVKLPFETHPMPNYSPYK